MVVRKMKEKCKDAARMRREKERVEFVELSKLLPLPASTTSQLDKASIIRLTSSYLRMRSAFPRGLGEDWGEHSAGSRYQQGAAATTTTTTSTTAKSNHRIFSSIHQANQSDYSNTTNLQNNNNNINNHQHHSSNNCITAASDSHANGTTSHVLQPLHIRELGSLILQTLDGFVFALHRDGKIMYISETASVQLGLPQIDLSGSSIFEYTHQADHNDLGDVLSLSESDRKYLDWKYEQQQDSSGSFYKQDHFELGRSFCMRMKCILPKRNAGLVSNGYKAIHCNGYLKVRRQLRRQLDNKAPLIQTSGRYTGSNSTTAAAAAASLLPATVSSVDAKKYAQSHCGGQGLVYDWECYALVAVGNSLLPTASTEVKLNDSSFMFRANLDLKLYYIEAPMIKLLGYQQSDLVGSSLYEIVHVADLKQLEQAHRVLLWKGQAVSRYFRLMRRSGGHIWIQVHATLVNNPRSMPKPQHIVCICLVIGIHEGEDNGLGMPSCLIEHRTNPVSQTSGQTNSQQAQSIKEQRRISSRCLGKQTTNEAVINTSGRSNLAINDGHSHTMFNSSIKKRENSKLTRQSNDMKPERQMASSKRKAKVLTSKKTKINPSVSNRCVRTNLDCAGNLANSTCPSIQNITSSSPKYYQANNNSVESFNVGSVASSPTMFKAATNNFSTHDNPMLTTLTTTATRVNSTMDSQYQLHNISLPQTVTPAKSQPIHHNSQYQTIGSIRRASDDSCSVVSSVLSTFSTCSSNNSSSINNEHFVNNGSKYDCLVDDSTSMKLIMTTNDININQSETDLRGQMSISELKINNNNNQSQETFTGDVNHESCTQTNNQFYNYGPVQTFDASSWSHANPMHASKVGSIGCDGHNNNLTTSQYQPSDRTHYQCVSNVPQQNFHPIQEDIAHTYYTTESSYSVVDNESFDISTHNHRHYQYTDYHNHSHHHQPVVFESQTLQYQLQPTAL